VAAERGANHFFAARGTPKGPRAGSRATSRRWLSLDPASSSLSMVFPALRLHNLLFLNGETCGAAMEQRAENDSKCLAWEQGCCGMVTLCSVCSLPAKLPGLLRRCCTIAAFGPIPAPPTFCNNVPQGDKPFFCLKQLSTSSPPTERLERFCPICGACAGHETWARFGSDLLNPSTPKCLETCRPLTFWRTEAGPASRRETHGPEVR